MPSLARAFTNSTINAGLFSKNETTEVEQQGIKEKLEQLSKDPQLVKMMQNPEIVQELKKLMELLKNKGVDMPTSGAPNPMMIMKLMADKDLKEQGTKIQELLVKNDIKLDAMSMMKLFNM